MDAVSEYRNIPSVLDFIANPKLIEKYANDENASKYPIFSIYFPVIFPCITSTEPTIPQLIDLILRQASIENPNEPHLRLMRCHRVDVDERTFFKTRRNRVAKTVTLMLASALNWNFDKIERDLSITMQFCLVQDLMNTVFSGMEYCSFIADPSNVPQRALSAFTADVLKPLPDHCVFGLCIYSRWILRAHIQRKVPKKPAKGGIVSIGAITDPVVLQGLDQQSQGFSLIWTLFRYDFQSFST